MSNREISKEIPRSLQERLADCKEFLLNEERSKKPSKLYIDDLQQSIKQIEYQIKMTGQSYEMVAK